MKEKVLITSALPYANGPLHFGHIAGAFLPADCYARFSRLMEREVLYISGSDEYGIAITLSAELAKRTPKEHVDIFHEINKNFFSHLKISFDHYSRTTWEGHKEVVQKFFLDLLKNGYIEERIEDHLFSEKENRFLADRYVIGTCPKCGYEEARGDECPKCGASYEALDLKNPRSKLSGSSLVLKKSNHWYLQFDKFKEKLSKWLGEKKWKPNVLKLSRIYVEELRPRSISRDSTWGVPLPLKNTEGKVFYVWFDAPIGYISATKEWAEKEKKPERWQEFWCDPKTKLIHFIGKDNIPFHTVFFPAMIMGQDLPLKLPDEVPANEFLLLEGRQFSKSEGWYIDLEKFFSRYTSDQIRYYLAANAPETADADFSWRDFQLRSNSELLGKWGNFLNRTLVFIRNRLNAKIPSAKHLSAFDQKFLGDINVLVEEAKNSYENFQLRKASQCIMELAQNGNVYFDGKKPWELAKNPEKCQELENTLYCSLLCIKMLALISSPILPDSAQKAWEFLGFSSELAKESWEKVKNTPLPEGQALPEPKTLFRKVEEEEIVEEIRLLEIKKGA